MAAIIVLGCSQKAPAQVDKEDMGNMDEYSESQDAQFKQMCQSKGWQWMLMKPTMNGKMDSNAKDCWGCMVEGVEHICDNQKFMELMK